IRIHSLVVSLACCILTIFLAHWHLLALRLWASYQLVRADLVRDRNKFQNWIDVAKNLREVCRIGRARGRAPRNLFPDNPRLQLRPFLVLRPSCFFFPVALDPQIPIALIFASEFLLLLREPPWVFCTPWLGNK